MRDIRPNKNMPGLGGLPPRSSMPEDLPPVPKPKTARRFTGSTVPISQVHIPKQSITSVPTSRPTSAPVPTKMKMMPVPPPKEEPVVLPPVEAEDAPRPLFAAVPKKKRAAAPSGRMRVGQRERLVLASFFVLILIAIGITGLIFLPKATITLNLQTAPLLVDERLTLVPGASGTDNTIAGTAFYREENIEGAAAVTSREVVGNKAAGTVELVNRTTEEQKIRERSRLVTKDGVLFYMINHAILPAASGGAPTRVSVQVEAAEPGESGNIAPTRLTFAALDASAQSLLYAENPQALTGGKGDEVAVVKAVDIEGAKAAAQQLAREKSEQELRSEVPAGWVILDESWTVELHDFATTAKEGDKVESIPYTTRATVRVMGYNDEQMQNTLRQALTSKLDSEYMLFPGAISFTKTVEKVNWDAPEATIAVRITHTTVPQVSLDTLMGRLAGRNKAEALAYLQGLKGVRAASIELWPFWVTAVPSIERRVMIDVKQSQ